MANRSPIIVTGATGRLGRTLHQVWSELPFEALTPVWQCRNLAKSGEKPDWIGWDMLTDPYHGPDMTGGVVLNLAGVTGANLAALSDNTALACAAWRAACEGGARHLFLISSAAVYGRGRAGQDADEAAPLCPANAYGQAKAAMETAALGWHAPSAPGLTILRIGNVAGSDALLGNAKRGTEVVLDPVPDGVRGPLRSYIGPRSLAQVLAQLCVLAARGATLPAVLNIAAPGAVAMADLLDAAKISWHFGPENPAVMPRVVLDTTALQHLILLPSAASQAQSMVDEWLDLEPGRV